MKKKESSNAFTLLEVMVALAVLSIALVVLIQLHMKGLILQKEADQITVATLLARAKMDETLAAGFPEPQKVEGDFGTDHPEYRWKLVVATTELEDVRKIDVSVIPPGGDEARAVHMETYVVRLKSMRSASAGGISPSTEKGR